MGRGRPLSSAPEEWVVQSSHSCEKVGGPDVFLEFRNALMANAGGILPKARKRAEATSVFRLICKPTDGSTSFAPRPQVLTPDPGYREDRRLSPRRDGWVVG